VLPKADTLYSDAGCATSVVDVSCHPFCAGLAISDPATSGPLCCNGVGAYQTKGLARIAACRS
jgi:hypothetical protein